ncbi:amidohydrolase family protein [Paenibacillus eucommiae]|uniref:L-fuconolactonase n=1 Tax=Paenibacillus eucommiae TaxID=1355755 RepID=A0ABS4IT19_9BACL|nr:amidohydrolase family protein [Paenibacillus eucommiae]MBP1990181.1 L-fuconolactonase [Paenibacillus eucommiae]
MIIDAHQHYWLLSRGDYDWLTSEAGKLFTDYMPNHLKPQLSNHGVARTIVVQSAPTLAETEFLLGLARKEPCIAGVVGWMNLLSGTFEEDLSRLKADPLFVGIRPTFPRGEDGSLLFTERLDRSLQVLADHDVPVDLLLSAHQLHDVIKLVTRAPTLRVVLNHIGNPTLQLDDWEAWADAIAAIAEHPGSYCKLSCMITRVPEGMQANEVLYPYVRHVRQCFGSERLLFGSDWPVCRLSGEYGDTAALLVRLLTDLTEEERVSIYKKNAMRVYGLK